MYDFIFISTNYSFCKITRRRYVKKAWYNLGYLIISNYSRWRIRQREVEQRNCAIHRDINDRRGQARAPRICRSLSQRSIAIHDGFTDVSKVLEGTRVTLYGKQGWSNLAVFFFLFFFFGARFVRPRRVRLLVRAWSFVSYAAYLHGSCGLYDPRTNERPIDRSILFRRSAK